MAKKPTSDDLRAYRIAVTLRILLATFGGYLCTLAAILFLVRVLPLSRSDAVVTAALASFTIFTLAVIWVFSAQNLRRAALGLFWPTLGFGLIVIIYSFAGGLL